MLAIVINFSACNKVEKSSVVVKTNTQATLAQLARSLTTKSACIANNGIWRKTGTIQRHSCVLMADDAGKSCVDNSQCQVACVIKENYVRGAQMIGQCYESTDQSGCRAYVNQGKSEGIVCID